MEKHQRGIEHFIDPTPLLFLPKAHTPRSHLVLPSTFHIPSPPKGISTLATSWASKYKPFRIMSIHINPTFSEKRNYIGRLIYVKYKFSTAL